MLGFSSLSWGWKPADWKLELKDILPVDAEGEAITSSNLKYHTTKATYIPLFNHYLSVSSSSINRLAVTDAKKSKLETRITILKKLAEFLNNNINGSSDYFEFINQQENDILLRMIVKAQLKQNDLLQLRNDYITRSLPEIQKLYLAPVKMAYEDGKKVLSNFISVQSRIEEIESGRWDLSQLTDELKAAYSGIKFKCIYSWYKDPVELEKYKIQTIKEHFKFTNDYANYRKQRNANLNKLGKTDSTWDSDWALFNDFKKVLHGYKTNQVELIDLTDTVSDESINKQLTGSWSQRLIVARCFKDTVVQKWEIDLKKYYDKLAIENPKTNNFKSEDIGLF